jgi:hypothetical protein
LRTWRDRLANGDSLSDVRREVERSDEARRNRREEGPIRTQPNTPFPGRPLPTPEGPIRTQPL